MPGFNRLKKIEWDNDQQQRIKKLFSGKPEDWGKKSLSAIRKLAKEDLLGRQKGLCAYCRREIADEIGKIELDHIIPKGILPVFTYHRLNLVATCKRCNHRKHEHNPLKRKSLRLVNYPSSESAYVWVHPYLHQYNRHIRIDGNGFYQAVNASLSGLAVITECGLSTMHIVVTERKRAIAKNSDSFETAILELITNYPKASSESLAKDLQVRIGNTVPISFLTRMIEEYRKANFATAKKIRAEVNISPYAGFIK